MAALFPDDLEPDEHGIVAIGAAITPRILLEAYRRGIFPWTGDYPIPWFSPDPRMVLLPMAFRASKSLRKLARQGRYEIRFDTAYPAVMEACAKAPRPGQEGEGTWITPNMLRGYTELHRTGYAHSVEVYTKTTGEDASPGGELVGGLYGLSLGRAFFGESMFALAPNTSKLALYRLCTELEARGFAFIDCQQETAHLASLGAHAIPRLVYLERLRAALQHETIMGPWTSWTERVSLAPPEEAADGPD